MPDDFAIVSIASSQRAAEMTMPALTTMEVPSTELGRLGVEALLAQLEDQQAPRLQRVLPCRLVVRGSSGPFGVERKRVLTMHSTDGPRPLNRGWVNARPPACPALRPRRPGRARHSGTTPLPACASRCARVDANRPRGCTRSRTTAP